MADSLPDDRTLRPGYVDPEPEESELDASEEYEGKLPDVPETDEEPEAQAAVSAPEASVPEVSEPKVTVPEVTVPEMTVPEVSVPEVSVPEVGPVLKPEDTEGFRVRWSSIQAGFIDDPRHAVEDADRFVADVARAFASGVESRRRTLTSVWAQDGRRETEKLRLTMRQYRALVDRILIG